MAKPAVRLLGPAILASAIGCTQGTIGPACGSNVGPQAPGESVRVLTFNTALFSPVFQCQVAGAVPIPTGPTSPVLWPCYFFNDLGGPIAERANQIADLIDPARFDIIVFNEVWDEDDGKDILVNRLCEAFPHHVRYVPESEDLEDSGLMVFSKFPFASLPDHEFEADSEPDSDRVAFVEFDKCGGVDCLAAKGAVLVRARHPSSDRIINIAGTHLNAGNYVSDRRSQFWQIVGRCYDGTQVTNVVETTVRPGLPGGIGGMCDWPATEWLLVMGDLNVHGEGAIGSAVFPTAGPIGGPDQWNVLMGSPAADAETTSYALYDAWAETTSEADAGLTDGTSRFDYVLASRVTRPGTLTGESGRQLCVQHIRVPREFSGLSDHRAVAADINLGAPQCAPRAAAEPSADDMGELGGANGKEARQLDGAITHPGSMQWWRLSDGGTYSVATSNDVHIEFFRADNLALPLGGSHSLGIDMINVCRYVGSVSQPIARCREEEAEKVVLPDGPIFVRVFDTNRASSHPYWIAFHKYTCKSPDEACELLPHAPQSFRFPPPGTALNLDDAAWFNIQVREQADSGAAQDLRFYVENRSPEPWHEPAIQLRDQSTAAVLTEIDGTPLGEIRSRTSSNGREMVTIDGRTRQNSRVMMRVKRASVDTALELLAGWRTNLILLGGSSIGPEPSALVCDDETDPEAGEDEIHLEVNVDGGGFQIKGSAGYDCNEKPHPRQWDGNLGVIRFLDDSQFRVIEGDAASPDDSSGTSSPDKTPFDSTDRPVGPVPRELMFEFDGGKYFFRFNIGKWRVQ